MNQIPRPLKYAVNLFLSIMLCTAQMPVWAQPEPLTDQQLENEYEKAVERARGRLTLGTRIGESSEGYLDVLQPLFAGDNSLLFLNPKLSGSDNDEEEISIGLGARLLLPDNGVILGANVFFDERRTRHDHSFDQVGAGVEMLSEWVDARANYYWPEDKQREIDRRSQTDVDQQSFNSFSDIYAQQHQLLQDQTMRTVTTTTSREFARYEAPLEGFDAEIGIRLPGLPDWLETRVFGGYYKFRGDFTDDIKGAKGRLEIRALPALFLDAEIYEDDELTGSDYFVGARLNVPFDLFNLARGRNPFAGVSEDLKAGKREFRDRMSEMIMRDPHVRIHESGFMEDMAALDVKTEVRGSSQTLVVLDDVNFVDNQYAGPGDGTAENPYPAVQQGVNNVFGLKNVYVFPGVGPYQENVVISENGVQLLGSGKGIQGFGGKVFGGTTFPVLDGNVGGVNGPVIRVSGNDVLIQGFDITRSPGGLNPGISDLLGFGITIDRIGILSENANNLTVFCNKFSGHNIGVAVLADGVPFYGATVEENMFMPGTGSAVLGIVRNASLFDMGILDNQISGAVNGIEVYAQNVDDVNLTLGGNVIENPASYGMYLDFGPGIGNVDVLLEGNEISGAGFIGMQLFANNVSGDVYLWLEGERYTGNNSGLSLNIGPVGNDVVIFMDDVQVNNNQGGAYVQVATVGGDVDVSILDSQFNDNSADSGFATVITGVGGDVSIFVDPTEFNNNAAQGFLATIVVDGNINMIFEDVTASGNTADGILYSAISETGLVQMLFRDVVANDNGSHGLLGTAMSDGAVVYGLLDISSFSFDDAIENRITANNNAGSGIVLNGFSFSNLVVQISDLLVANGNGGDGVYQLFSAEAPALSFINEIQANNNGGHGGYITMLSASNLIFVDIGSAVVNSNANSGLFLSANAMDTAVVTFGLPTTLLGSIERPSAGAIIANDNGSQGVYAGLNSASGSIVFVARDLELKGNQSGGIVLSMSGYDDVSAILGAGLEGTNLIEGTIHADHNSGAGILINAISANGGASASIFEGTANSNVAGVIMNLNSESDATAALGAGFVEMFSLQPLFGSFYADGNTGGAGIDVNVFSSLGGAVFLFAEGGASANEGGGLDVSLVADDNVVAFLGGVFGVMNTGFLTFNDNTNQGVQVFASSANDGVTFGTSGLEMNRNTGFGGNIQLIASNNVTAIMGIAPLGTNYAAQLVQANDNNIDGLNITAISSGGDVAMVAPFLEANNNNGNGIQVTAIAPDGEVDIALAGISGALPLALDGNLSVQADDNGGHGIVINSIAGQSTLLSVGSGSADNNAADGVFAFVSSAEGANIYIGQVFQYPNASLEFSASGNTQNGLNIFANSSSGRITFAVAELDASENGLNGLAFNGSAFDDLTLYLGVTVVGGTNPVSALITTHDNGGSGMDITGYSLNGRIDLTLPEFSSVSNAGSGVQINLSAEENVTAVIGELNVEGTPVAAGSGIASGNDLHGLSLNSLVSISGSVTARISNVTANDNGQHGIAADLITTSETALASVQGVTAIGNGWNGVNVEVSAGAGTAWISASDLLLNNNQHTGGVFIARGALLADIGISNFSASANAYHGVLAGTDNTMTGRIEIAADTINDNGGYGFVSIVVASNSASQSSSYLTANGNGLGDFYTVSSFGATNWFDIEP